MRNANAVNNAVNNALDDEREQLGLKRCDATTNAAIGMIEGKDIKGNKLSPIAEEIRERARLREAADAARSGRIRRLRELAGPDGGDAA